MESTNHRSPEEIQHDMECTRQEIDKSVERLEAKLTPDRLIAGAERWLTGGRVSESGPLKEHVAAFVRGYPLPAAMIGAAAAWVIADRFLAGTAGRGVPGQAGLSHGHGMGGDTIKKTTHAVSSGLHAVGDAVKSAAGAVKHGAQAVGSGLGTAASVAGHTAVNAGEAAVHGAQSVGHAASTAAHTVGHYAGSAAHAVGHTAHQVGSTIGHTAHQVGHTVGHAVSSGARTTKHTLVRTYDDYPIGMGLVAAGVGLAVGLLVPHTRAEDRLLGHVADKAKDEASRVKSKVTQQIGEVAAEAKHTGKALLDEVKAEIKPERRDDPMNQPRLSFEDEPSSRTGMSGM